MYRQPNARCLTKALYATSLRPFRPYQLFGNRTIISPSTSKARFLAVPFRRLLVGSFVAVGAYVIYEDYNSKLPLDTTTFLPFVLQSKKSVSWTSSIFTVTADFASIDDRDYSDVWNLGVWSVQLKQPQIQIARSYTPLPPLHAEDSHDKNTLKQLRFLIRREPQGEVSGYLHRLPLGARIALSGPHIEYAIPQDADEVVFIAGGTGIAPALQSAYILLERRDLVRPKLKVHILWANRRREEVLNGVSDTIGVSTLKTSSWRNFFWAPPLQLGNEAFPERVHESLVNELEIMKRKYQGKLVVDYFIDEEGSFITKDILKARLTSHDNSASKTTGDSPPSRRLILISGPEGFVTHFAGPKRWASGKETQGPLGGILKTIKPSDWDVWKL